MYTIRVLILLLVAGLVIMFALPASSHPADAIVVTNADSVIDAALSSSPSLGNVLANVAPRFVVQYANSLRDYRLMAIPSSLQSRLAEVGTRVVIQYANANRFYAFTYPLAMIGDTTAPNATAPVVTLLGRGSVKISWTTNEFAQTRFRYGAQPGVYTQTLTDTLYYKLHEITLNGLVTGKTYYFRFSNTDRSGNTFQSAEYHFVVNVSVYLPLIKK